MKNRPVLEVKLGSIKGTVWLNANKKTPNGKTVPNISITKLYKQDGSWKRTTSFSHKELVLVAKVADQIHTELYQKAQK